MEKAEFESILSSRGIASNERVEVTFRHNEENNSVAVTAMRRDVPESAASASCLLSSSELPQETIDENIQLTVDHVDQLFRQLDAMTDEEVSRLKAILRKQRQINRK